MFSYEFQRIQVSTDETSVDIAITDTSGVALISERYFPDAEGMVTLYDIDKVLDAFIGIAPFGDIQVVLDSTVAASVRVFRCSVATDMTASQFTNTRFFVSSDAPRKTAPGRYEVLNWYQGEALAVNASYVAYDESKPGKLLKGTVQLKGGLPVFVGSMVNVNVSPERVFSEPERLLQYTVTCGQRSQTYIVDSREAAADPAVIFRNRFNVWDTYYFSGTKTTDPQFDREMAWINGQYINYRTSEVMQYKAMTPPIGPEDVAAIEDIVRSPELHLLKPDGSTGDLITILDADIAADNKDNSLMRLTVTYRRADRISAKSFAYPSGKIFDNTYDNSYE